MWNIIIGILFIIGGASGDYVLAGTDSSGALIAVGIGLIIWGCIQLGNKKEEEK